MSVVGGQKASDVLEDQPVGVERISESYELGVQAGSEASQPSTLTGHGEVLARTPSGDDVGSSHNASKLVCIYIPHVGPSGHIGETFGEDSLTGGVPFDLGGDVDPCGFEAEVEATHAGEQADGVHAATSHRLQPHPR